MNGSFDTVQCAERLIPWLVPHRDAAFVVTLSGELGAGKTTFVQALAEHFGVQEAVTSPTFVIQKNYPLTDAAFSRLVHIDAYRLQSVHELEVLGWHELMADNTALVVLEWPERVPECIPTHALTVRFDIEGERRIITINGKKAE